MSAPVLRSYKSPGRSQQVLMMVREDTVDEPVISPTALHDEYGVAAMGLRPGDLMVDVGAYIGSVGLAVAADYPEARVVMVEAIPENADLILQSVYANGWGSRCTVYNAAAAAVPGESVVRFGAASGASEFEVTNRYIGNLVALGDTAPETVEVPNITLERIVNEHGPIAWLKIDCEGCEYGFLDSGWVMSVENIVGEYHGGEADILRLLAPTHLVMTTPENENVGIFRGMRH